MKTLFTFTLVLFLINLGKAQTAFKIKATTNNPLNGYKVVLTNVLPDTDLILFRDTTNIINNKFEFKGKIKGACQLGLFIFVSPKNEKYLYNFALDSGTNNMKLELITAKKRVNQTAKKSRSNMIHETLDSIMREEYISHKKNKDDINELHQLTWEQAINLKKKYFDVLSTYPNDYYSLMRLIDLSKFAEMVNQEEMILNCYNTLSDSLKSSETGRKFYQIMLNRVQGKKNASPGSRIIDFTVKNFDGSTFTNKSLSGQPYIIVFSATWCIPCQQQLPKTIELFNKYIGIGLKLVYFNMDDNKKTWAAHIAKHQTTWINVSEGAKFSNSPIAKQLHVTHVPTYFLIDRDGKIVFNSDAMKGDQDDLELYIPKVLKTSK